MRLGCGLIALALSALSCAPDEVVIWSLPSAGGGNGGMVTASAGAAGAASGTGGFFNDVGGLGGGSGSGGLPLVAGSGGSSGAPANSGGGGDGGSASDCGSNDDCPVSWVCVKPDCSSPGGVCEPRPVFCPPEPLPVCGCDHVTYWNDCVRRQSGAVAAELGECRSNAMPCQTGADCGVANASCARFVPKDEPCDAEAPGVCWVAPAVCEPGIEPPRWKACGPMAPDPAPCIDTCQAILEECAVQPVHHDTDCN